MLRLAVLACVALGCSDPHRARLVDPNQPVRVEISTPSGDAAVTVDVADTNTSVSYGLMDRMYLPPDRGMLFFMGKLRPWAFYMRRTPIALDIVFITPELTVAGVLHDMKAFDETSRWVDRPSLYVLEVNAGWAKAHRVVAGARVQFDNIASP